MTVLCARSIAVHPEIDQFKVTPRATKTGQSFELECRASGYPRPAPTDYTIHKVGPDSPSLTLTAVAGGVVVTVKDALASADAGEYNCLVNVQWNGTSLLPAKDMATAIVYGVLNYAPSSVIRTCIYDTSTYVHVHYCIHVATTYDVNWVHTRTVVDVFAVFHSENNA